MKSLMTVNSNKFNDYVKSNDTRLTDVEARVNKATAQMSELNKLMREMQSKLKIVEEEMKSTTERVNKQKKIWVK